MNNEVYDRLAEDHIGDRMTVSVVVRRDGYEHVMTYHDATLVTEEATDVEESSWPGEVPRRVVGRLEQLRITASGPVMYRQNIEGDE